jgi:hypothetical protein
MRDFDAILDKAVFAQTVEQMSPFYGLSRQSDISEAVALQSIQGFTNILPSNQIRPPQELTDIVKYVVNTSDGTLTARDLIEVISNRSSEAPSNTPLVEPGVSLADRIGKYVKIYYPAFGTINEQPFFSPRMDEILGRVSGLGVVNGNPSSPDKDHPGLSVIQINSVQVMPSNKNVNAITLFMNGMPPFEIQRAIPFVKIQFFFGRDPTDQEGRLQTVSLFKYLEGATNQGLNIRENNENNPLVATRRLLADANTVSGSITGGRSESGFLSTAGMEIFCAPQTLLNTENGFDPSLRTVPIIDKFRPFLTFKDLSIDIAPAAGLMSYKTAKMQFTLHDRSRLHEIADFIKPDLYGTTELLLEYGWSHPGSTTTNIGSNIAASDPYGMLINGMRCREKYGIRNMQAIVDDTGQINITLDLFMKGGNEFLTENIASNEDNTTDILREIGNLARMVSSYERRLGLNNQSSGNGNSSHQPTREIRGSQILATAADYQGQLQLTPELLTNLREFRRSLNTTRSPDARELINLLGQLYNNRTNPSSSENSGGALSRLSSTTQRSIENKIRQITGGGPSSDPFIPPNTSQISRENRIQRRVEPIQRGDNVQQVGELNVDRSLTTTVSLGKLLINFLGVPLALTNKFDDIQFVFYPFNKYAGMANTLNISQFTVDVRYFVRQYTRYRTETMSRAANLTLKEFLQFIADVIIDDPGAVSYGIYSLYRRVLNRTTGQEELQASNRSGRQMNSVEFQTEMENILRNQTPDGSFKMPQIDFYAECLPGKIVREGQTIEEVLSRSILRIHVFDKQCSQYESQAGLLASCRDDLLTSIGSVPQGAEVVNEGVHQSHQSTANAIIDLANSAQLVEPVRNRENSGISTGAYRIRKGPQTIKDFVMSTMPYIIFGIQGSSIIGQANLQTMQDSALSTVNMLRSFRASPLQANGEQPGGLPLSIIPCELNLSSFGCPLIDFAQQFFIDFQTGTTWDNIFGVVGLSHKFSGNMFTTDIKFAPLDAYGKYNSMIQQVNLAADRLAMVGQ